MIATSVAAAPARTPNTGAFSASFADNPSPTTTNAGTMTTNAGTMTTNAGTMTTNAGTMTTNAGTMKTNAGTMMTNAGTMTTNARPSAHRAGRAVRGGAFAALVVAAASSAHAQCVRQWQPVDPGISGTRGQTYAMTMWDPDGMGPQMPKLVVAGDYDRGGGFVANNIVTFDPITQQWAALGSDVAGSVQALAPLPNGDLVAAGTFTRIENLFLSRIARRDAATGQWTRVGFQGIGGLSARVNAVVALPNGDIVAGGVMQNADNALVSNIARWNAATGQWEAMGSGITMTQFFPPVEVLALTALPNGDVIAGGFFNNAGGVVANNIARWNAATNQWSAMGIGVNGGVRSLITLPDGDVIASGVFTAAGGVPASNVARWNAATGAWSALGGGVAISAWAVTSLPDSNVVAGGFIETAGGVAANHIARFDAASGQWAPLGTGPGGPVQVVSALPSGDVFAAGYIVASPTTFPPYLARWTCGTTCDDIDFNNNDVFPEDADVIDFFNVLAGAECAACNDIDFNNNGVFPEDQDVIDFFNVLAGGECP